MRNLFACWILALGAAVLPVAQAADALLASQVLALDRELHALERAAAPKAALQIFVGSQADALRLRSVKLRVDDLEPTVYEYAEPEWEALAAGGLHPALSLDLPPGAHRLRVELYGRGLDAGPSDPRAVEHLDQRIELAPGTTAVELAMTQQRFGRSGLLLRESREASRALSRGAQFWLAADRPWLAARLLSRAAGDVDSEMLAASMARLSGQRAPSAQASAVDRFEAALAAAGRGDPQALGLIAAADAETEAAWSMRDHAHLLLGYAHLRQGDGERALEALAQVRSPGPQGNAALLGFGWAFLVQPATQGALAPSPALSERPAFARLIDARVIQAPRDKDAQQERREALERALVPWAELIGRDPLDLHAQEGALAVAWALDQLGTGAQAHVYYERAAHQLETARAQLDLAMRHVGSGAAAQALARSQRDASSGWRAWLADLPYADDTAYLKYLLADPATVVAVDDYLAARLLHDEIEDLATRLAALPAQDAQAALATRLQAARSRAQALEQPARAAFERRALEQLQARKQHTERYLVEARFAMARHFDSAPPPETEIVRGAFGGRS